MSISNITDNSNRGLEKDTLDLYKKVLKSVKRWPNGYWKEEDAKENYDYDEVDWEDPD